MKIFQRVIELWPAQDFITVGGNSRMESVRVIILLRDMPAQGILHIGEVSWKYLKGFRVMARTRFNNYGR